MNAVLALCGHNVTRQRFFIALYKMDDLNQMRSGVSQWHRLFFSGLKDPIH
jgi:hypothetical protein